MYDVPGDGSLHGQVEVSDRSDAVVDVVIQCSCSFGPASDFFASSVPGATNQLASMRV